MNEMNEVNLINQINEINQSMISLKSIKSTFLVNILLSLRILNNFQSSYGSFLDFFLGDSVSGDV